MSNFFSCHYVFKKPSAAEASKSVYMRERVNGPVVLITYQRDTVVAALIDIQKNKTVLVKRQETETY